MNKTNGSTENVTKLLVDQHIAGTRGNHSAFRYRDHKYTYHDLAALMNRAGNMMRDLGVHAGDHVLLIVPPSPPLVASLLGAMKIGAVPSVLSKDITGEAVQSALRRLTPALIVVNAEYLDAVQSETGTATGSIVVVGDGEGRHKSFVDAVRAAPSSLSGAELERDAPAFAVLGEKKVVIVSHGRLRDAMVDESDGKSENLADWPIIDALRAFASCQEAALPSS